MATATIIQVQLSGRRPLIFDRYAGDNNTQLPVSEKMYLDSQRRLIMPALNLYSLLVAENTKSVCRQFFGKSAKTVALGISSYTMIDPLEIPILDANGEPFVFDGWRGQLSVRKDVARLPKGIPNPKERPMLNTPWQLNFEMQYEDNKYCTLENLRMAFIHGGILGIGSFRPFFGRYQVTNWQM